MDCKTFVKLIPQFIKDDLENEDLRQFLDHVNECEECKEELTIEIMVKEGLNSLESGSLFDVKKEYETKIENADKALRLRDSMMALYHMLGGLVAVLLITMILIMIFLV